jgi:uncharacterized protein (TIGR00369 family)
MEISEALGRPIPFGKLLGVRLVQHGNGHAVLEVDLVPDLLNSVGVAHGGVTMTLLDIAMSLAARTRDPKGVMAVTIEMKTSFLAPARGKLTVKADCLQLGASVAFCEGEGRDANGDIVARATGTFMVRREKG